VVKYSSPPNTGCCTSPSFTTEFFVANAPDGVIQNTNIVVTAGEHIGVIGTGGTVGTSYTTSGIHPTTINGQPTNLYRMGYQGPMAATAHTSNLWGQTTNGQIGRVELYWSPPSTAPNDAGVASVDSPATFCDGAQNIVATIKNYGINQINNVTVNWSFNGVLQTPVNHTTLLDTFGGTGPQTAQIVLGTKTFVANQTDDIEVWTTMPNGVVDTVTKNDSVMASVQPSLNGTFTINPAGIGATNYLTFADAVNDLNTYGVCGPVTFNVTDGVYAEQVSLGNIDGTSATNTITFQADPANTGPVELDYFGASTDNYIIRFNGASYVTFDGINAKTTGSYATVVRFEGGAHHNEVKNAVLSGQLTTSTSTNYAVVYSNGFDNAFNKIVDNEIMYGSYGVYFRGSSTSSLAPGIEISGNTFTDPYYYGMYFYYTDGLKVMHNEMSSSSNYTSGRGIHCYYGDNGLQIAGNVITNPSGNRWPRYGIYAYYCDGQDTARTVLANNMIHVGNPTSTTQHYGIYANNCNYTDMVYNNVVVEGTSTTGRAAYPYNGGNNACHNNNFLNYGNGYTVYALSGSYSMDHNNLATNGGNFGYYSGTVSDFTAWQAKGIGANSINVDSVFTNLDSLRTCHDSLYARGTVVNVIDDIDGDPRSATAPNIGADEFINDPNNFTIGDTVNFCGGSSVEIGATMNDATFLWSTGATTPTIVVTEAGTYSVTVDGACATGMTDDVVVYDRNPIANFTIGNGDAIRGFENTSTNGVSYSWDFGDGTTSTEVNPWHKYDENGQYEVSLTVMNECDTVTFTQTVSITVGINEVTMNDGLSIYPNPASEQINISLEGDVQQVQVEIYTITGQLETQHQLNLGNGIVETLDISNLKTGVYIFKMNTANNAITQRLVIE
jgi:PKD repeat protein